MKSILLDTNVVLDVLRDRKLHAAASTRVWGAVETGKVAGLHMQAQLLRRIALILGVSADYLLGLDEPEQATSNGQSESPQRAKGRAKVKG